ncbi:MAG: radical SAM protein, partial [bacterium]
EQLLLGLAQIEGIYVPRFYEPHYNQDGTMLRFDARDDVPPRPRRRFVKDLSKFKTHSRILTSETEFKSMFLTETGRGCEMGCRFCVAGYIYRPIRKRSEEVLQETVQIGLENSDAIGFVGAAVSSHKSIAKLAQKVAESGARASLSSIMSQKVSKALAASISESEYKTVALAPEAGSTRLRRAAGKRVDNEQVINAARELAESGIRGFKLYFIVGLPTETDEDVDAIAALAITIRDTVFEISKPSGKLAWVSLSINPFIPKASTPFQWESMLDPKVLDKKIERIRKLVIKVPNLELRFEPPKESYFQGLLSRGDRRVVRLLLEVERRGENWKWLMKKTSAPILEGVPAVDFYVSRKIGFNELLPWEVVDSLIPRDLLEREAMRAYHGEGWTQPRAPEQPIIDGEDDIMRGVTL